MTIRELRYRDAVKLATTRNEAPTMEEVKAAQHALTLFYRFAHAYSASFYTEQDCNASEAEKAAADEKSEKAYKHAADALKPYKMVIRCPGLYPCIDHENGCNFTYGHYYN